MKTLKRLIVEKLTKMNECGGGYSAPSCGGGHSSSSSKPTSATTVKSLTADIYESSVEVQRDVDKIIKLSQRLGKRMPSKFKKAIEDLKGAAKAYQSLVDQYSAM